MITKLSGDKDSTETMSEPTATDEIDVDQMIENRMRQRERGDVEDPSPSPSPAPAPAPIKLYYPKAVEEPAASKYDDGDMPHTAGHHTADPFAPREGKTLVWRDVNMTLVRYSAS